MSLPEEAEALLRSGLVGTESKGKNGSNSAIIKVIGLWRIWHNSHHLLCRVLGLSTLYKLIGILWVVNNQTLTSSQQWWMGKGHKVIHSYSFIFLSFSVVKSKIAVLSTHGMESLRQALGIRTFGWIILEPSRIPYLNFSCCHSHPFPPLPQRTTS